MPSSSRSSEPLWDPIKAFGILNQDKFGEFSCVGWAPSRGRRCQNRIAMQNKTAATMLLKDMSYQDPNRATEANLELVAGYGLCRNYHQPQKQDMVNKWKNIIAKEQRQLEQSRARGSSSSQRTRDARNQVPTPSPVPSSETRAPRPRPVDATPARRTELVDSIAEAVAESLRDVITARATENLAATLRDTITAQLQARDTSSNDSTSDTTDASSAISFDTLSDSDSEISDDESTAAPRCTANHVARRPIDRHCVICRERMSRRRLDELVWCKSECGKSFHKDCFERWRENSSQIDSVGTLRCVICRTVWAGACVHDNQVP